MTDRSFGKTGIHYRSQFKTGKLRVLVNPYPSDGLTSGD